ncbi:hypothetical protein R3P38DRAFT_3019224 [Favolaschia claudopus]|uniref:Chromo domain-containing protein n=1 Tax=Favolaschia claudopus TaxID=2862362 RepID=A0AAW0AJA1_9AGAR
MGRRRKTKDYEIEAVVGEKVTSGERWFKVRWKGWSEDYDEWKPEEDVTAPELIDRFLAGQHAAQAGNSASASIAPPSKFKRSSRVTTPKETYPQSEGQYSVTPVSASAMAALASPLSNLKQLPPSSVISSNQLEDPGASEPSSKASPDLANENDTSGKHSAMENSSLPTITPVSLEPVLQSDDVAVLKPLSQASPLPIFLPSGADKTAAPKHADGIAGSGEHSGMENRPLPTITPVSPKLVLHPDDIAALKPPSEPSPDDNIHETATPREHLLATTGVSPNLLEDMVSKPSSDASEGQRDNQNASTGNREDITVNDAEQPRNDSNASMQVVPELAVHPSDPDAMAQASGSARDANKRPRSPSLFLADTEPPAKRKVASGLVRVSDMSQYQDEPSWEGFVQKIETVEDVNDERFVHLIWHTGEHKIVRSETCHSKLPSQLLRFYESKLRWKED